MKFRLYLKSFDKENLLKTSFQLKKVLDTNNYRTTSIIVLPHRIKKFCVIRSPHVDKDSREQFEIRIYKSFFNIEVEQFNSIRELLNLNDISGTVLSLKILSF